SAPPLLLAIGLLTFALPFLRVIVPRWCPLYSPRCRSGAEGCLHLLAGHAGVRHINSSIRLSLIEWNLPDQHCFVENLIEIERERKRCGTREGRPVQDRPYPLSEHDRIKSGQHVLALFFDMSCL